MEDHPKTKQTNKVFCNFELRDPIYINYLKKHYSHKQLDIEIK